MGRSISSFLLTFLFFTSAQAANFNIQNRCSYTVWAAAVPGGGMRLDSGQSWSLNVKAGTTGRVWARTGCRFDEVGREPCMTGDCDGVLRCQGYGTPPNTLAEYSLNQFGSLVDVFDMSLADGFNVPMKFNPTSNGCSRGITCNADVNGQCPTVLKTTDGCNNPCTVFKTDEYCCTSGSCNATDYSRYFKGKCPDAYSYPKDDQNSIFVCPGGTNYEVIFCPDGSQSNHNDVGSCTYELF